MILFPFFPILSNFSLPSTLLMSGTGGGEPKKKVCPSSVGSPVTPVLLADLADLAGGG